MEFQAFPKMARWSREIIVTEKIDGTNAQVYIGEDGEILAGSRTRWITPDDDNFGFAAWVRDHTEELRRLGPGRHFGEWWGRGIQRNYGLDHRRFSLFNAVRWCGNEAVPGIIPSGDPRIVKSQQNVPACCDVVPVLWRGNMDDFDDELVMLRLAGEGSSAEVGFMKPEGIVIYHIAAGVGFKKTFEKDASGKGE